MKVNTTTIIIRNTIVFLVISIIFSNFSCMKFDPDIPCSDGYFDLIVNPASTYNELTINWNARMLEEVGSTYPYPEHCVSSSPATDAHKQTTYSSSPSSVSHVEHQTLHIGIWNSRLDIIGDNCPTVVFCQHEIQSSGGHWGLSDTEILSHDLTFTETSCSAEFGIRGFHLISDFSLYPNNTPPCNWVERWNTNNSDWIISNGTLVGQQTNNSRRLLSWSVPPAESDIEILAKVLTHDKSDAVSTQIHFRASGLVNNMSSYFIGLSSPTGNDQLRLRSFIGSNDNDIGSYNFSYSTNSWYWIRVRIEGNNIKAKVWPENSSEPGNWHIDTNNADIIVGSWVGVGTYSANDNPYFGWFSLGLGGQSAGHPPE